MLQMILNFFLKEGTRWWGRGLTCFFGNALKTFSNCKAEPKQSKFMKPFCVFATTKKYAEISSNNVYFSKQTMVNYFCKV